MSFDPTKDLCELGGVSVYGWADTKFSITPNNSRSTVTEGVDGDIAVNVDSRFSGTLTINLMQTSSMCGVLDAWIRQSYTSGLVIFPVTIKSESSNMTLNTLGWIQDQAEYAAEQETGTRTYVIGLRDTRMLPDNPVSRAIQAEAIASDLLN